MCEKEGISLPPKTLKVWAYNYKANFTSAPMLSKVKHVYGYRTGLGPVDFFCGLDFINVSANMLITFFRSLLPDVTIGLHSLNLRDIYEVVNHEFAHASHFSTVGSPFWADYISYIITSGAYGSNTSYNSGLCGVSEMWGYAMGYIQVFEKYGDPNTPVTRGSGDDIRSMEEYPNEGGYNNGSMPKPLSGSTNLIGSSMAYPGTNWWFKPHILWELYRDKHLTKKEIYDCLQPDIRSHPALKNKMIALYPTKKGAIDTIFGKYGF